MHKELTNIFIIPSWYPSKSLPIFASFVQEQALAMANHRTEYRIIVSLRSDADVQLSAKKPTKILHHFRRGTFAEIEEVILSDNFIELTSPAFSLIHFTRIHSAILRLYALTERNLKYAVKKYGQISLIHVHVGYPAGFVAALLSKKYGVPYVITEHMSPFPFDSLIKNDQLLPELRTAFKNASGSIAVSNSLADRIASFGFSRPLVIPNMIDETRFKVSASVDNGFVFLSAGGLIAQKGFSDLLDAISIWKPKTTGIKFKIIGHGHLATSLKNKSKQLGIEHYIEWLGPVSRDKIPGEFANCNAFVLPSHHETFGIVYVEALASGKPVIATRCGGPEDIVNSSNGLLIEKGNPAELAKAMEWMYNNWSNFNPKNIRKDFEQRFSQKQVCRQIANLYDDIILNSTQIKNK